MTIKEAENFYKQDKKDYVLNKQSIIKKLFIDFTEIEKIKLKQLTFLENYLIALKKSIKNIYNSIKETQELQDLIDFLTNWYEIKYPNKELDINNGTIYLEYKNIKPISNNMDINQLLFRLENCQEDIMRCDYRARSWSCIPIKINNKIIRDSSIHVTLKINKENNYLKNEYFVCLDIDYKTGAIPLDDYTIKCLMEYISEEDIKKGWIHIENLLEKLLNKSNGKVDYFELLETVLDRNLRLKIRKEILELTALKILYSKNSIPEYGYERAKRFIAEMNKKLNTELTTDKIDEIMNRNYIDEKRLIKNHKL